MILIVIVLLLLGWSYVSEGKPITQGQSVPVTGVTPTLEPVLQMIKTVEAQTPIGQPSGSAP